MGFDAVVLLESTCRNEDLHRENGRSECQFTNWPGRLACWPKAPSQRICGWMTWQGGFARPVGLVRSQTTPGSGAFGTQRSSTSVVWATSSVFLDLFSAFQSDGHLKINLKSSPTRSSGWQIGYWPLTIGRILHVLVSSSSGCSA